MDDTRTVAEILTLTRTDVIGAEEGIVALL
jgi:hypothetical protein